MIFINIGAIFFVVAFVLLIGAGILDSFMQIYAWLESNIFYVILFLIILILPNVIKYIYDCDKNKIRMSSSVILTEVISHIIFIVSVYFFIKDMSALYDAHPVATVICSFPALIIVGIPLLYKISCIGLERSFSIAVIIISILLFIVSVIPDANWGTKMLLDIIFAAVTALGVGLFIN